MLLWLHKKLEKMNLKSMDFNYSKFKFVDNDISTLKFEDIVSVLPESNAISIGNRVKYQFSGCVDILEA